MKKGFSLIEVIVVSIVAVVVLTAIFYFVGVSNRNAREFEKARAQVETCVENLDAQTNDTGTYIRVPNGDLEEIDPWGTPLKVLYSQGGVMEVIKVSSAGKDKSFGTNDDLVAHRQSTNLKGLGNGIKGGAEETSESIAAGLVKGVKRGLKKKE